MVPPTTCSDSFKTYPHSLAKGLLHVVAILVICLEIFSRLVRLLFLPTGGECLGRGHRTGEN